MKLHRDHSQPLAELVRKYGLTYAATYRSAFDALPPASGQHEEQVRGEIAHWCALEACGDEAVQRRSDGTLAGLARSYAGQQQRFGAGNRKAAATYAELVALAAPECEAAR